MRPPPLPSEILRRVLRMARFDGTCVLGIAGSCALISAAARDVTGAVVGLLVAGAGAVELHGMGLLRSGDSRGMRWLVTSQLGIMVSILGYAAARLSSPDVAALRKAVTPEIAEQIRLAGMGVDDFLSEMVKLVYFAVCLVTILYQGGMTLYYLRRSSAVARALEEEGAD